MSFVIFDFDVLSLIEFIELNYDYILIFCYNKHYFSCDDDFFLKLELLSFFFFFIKILFIFIRNNYINF